MIIRIKIAETAGVPVLTYAGLITVPDTPPAAPGLPDAAWGCP